MAVISFFQPGEIFAVQGLKQVFNQLGCYPALAGKNPEGVCSLARPFNAGFIERALGFHRIADLLQQIFRTANAVFTQGKARSQPRRWSAACRAGYLATGRRRCR